MTETMRRTSSELRARRRIQGMLAAAAAAALGSSLLVGALLWGRGNSGVLGRFHARDASPTAVTLVGHVSASPNAPLARSLAPAPVSGAAPATTTHEQSPSHVHLLSGVEVAMGPDTRLSPLSEQPQGDCEVLVLDSGFIHVDVPKLPVGHTFEVRTPNALVIVHGTSFSVEVTRSGPSGAPVTRVVVSNGVVTVRHADSELLVGAGMEWASSNETSARAKPSPVPAPSRSVQRHGREPTAAPSAAPPISGADAMAESPKAETDLAEQNRSFGQAIFARERGDLAGAVRILDSFVVRHPASPLAQDAYVERFRILARMGDLAAAARAARRYLTLYQDGFARDEARRIALETGAKP
jgi:hypothetical protein